MLSKTKIWIVALAIACFSVFVLSSSSSFRDCVKRQGDAYSQETKKDPPKLFFAVANQVASCIKCTGHLAYEYRDSVTAAATVLIAVFTYTLFAATKGLVASAQIQSNDMKAAIAAANEANRLTRVNFVSGQRPWIIVENALTGGPGTGKKIWHIEYQR